tara:strand:- start:25473 stop:28196 length:2724 start_codon:yes stop_codon:yes gene_type:complete
MSVELYIYPQDYGTNDVIPIDFLPDYNFTTLNASSSQIETSTQNALNSIVPSSLPFTFYRFGNAAINYPLSPISGNINLRNGGGFIQRMTGMVVGVYYKLKCEFVNSGSGFDIVLSTGTVINFTYSVPNQAAGAFVDYGFYVSDPSTVLTIKGNGNSTTTNWRVQNYVDTSVSDGQVLVDLFDEKQIPLTLSVDNFQNAAEKTQSYSKAFKLPGTDRNNKIFRNIFDITSETKTGSIDFNPYRKTQIVLQENGSTIFKGFLRMINVDDNEGNLIYNVSLYSETVQIKDVLKGKTFYDLDFSELRHLYAKSVIKSSWDNSPGLTLEQPLPAGTFAGVAGQSTTTVLKYPFVVWTHQATIANNPGAPPASGPADGMPEFASLGQVFRPWISVRYIIDRIFEAAGYTWSSSFLTSADFEKIYMDFNWGANRAPMIGNNIAQSYWKRSNASANVNALNSAWTTLTVQQYFGWGGFSFVLPDFNQTTGQYVCTQDWTNLQFNPSWIEWENTFNATTSITVEVVKNGGLTAADTISMTFTAGPLTTGTASLSALNNNWLLMLGDTVELRWITTLPGGSQNVRLQNTGEALRIFMAEEQINMTTSNILMTQRGKLKQWDFLKGILTTFNLLTVADPTNSRNIQIEKYDTIFPQIGTGGGNLDSAARGITKDWTEKIDAKKIVLKPLTKLKKTTLFKYLTDSNDYTATNYKNAFGGFEYGSLTFDASDLNLLTGDAKVQATPFSATLNKPFGASTPELWTPAIYKLKDDGTSEEFANKPRLCYDNGRTTMANGTVYIPPANGESSENANTYLQFSSFSDYPILATSNDLNFGTCQLIGADNPSPLNLFNRFFARYYFDLYNPDTRIVTLKIKLTSADINQFSFSDIIMVKNRAYRVNKINYNPNQIAKVELILIP